MPAPSVNRRRRSFKILRLFFGFVISFTAEYVGARLTGQHYDFFRDSERNRKRAIRLRDTALEMGGVLVKVGQFLSSRVDLLPSEYIEELALLQDEVPGVPFAGIRAVIEAEFGAPLESIFREFNPSPVAAASLGQVHEARLPTGARVAVKVQRPGIEQIVEADLDTIRYIVRWLDRYTPVGRRADLPQILTEFVDTLRLELDYISEGHHAERLSVCFAGRQDIAIPRVFWSHSTRRVLTLQHMSGIKVTDFEELDRQGISRSVVAQTLMQAYLEQVLEFGFFHADPHPGNILVTPGPVIVLLDFGMVGEITPSIRANLRTVFLSVIRRDFDSVVTALGRLGFFTRDADRRALKRAIVWTVDTFYDISLGELRTLDPRKVVDQLQDVLFSASFRIPPNYAFLGRAVGTLSGLCTALDPSFQFFTVAEPYAHRLIRGDRGWRGVIEELVEEARSFATTAYSLPFLGRSMLEDLQTGESTLQHQLTAAIHSVDRVERSLRGMLHALLVIGFLLAGVVVLRTHYAILAVPAFAAALLFFVGLIFTARRRIRARSF